jgi:ribosome modulation factor
MREIPVSAIAKIDDPRLLIEVAGHNARVASEPITTCPYSYQFRKWWITGWQEADEDIRLGWDEVPY